MRLLLVAILLLVEGAALAQDLPRPDAKPGSWEIFLRRDAVNGNLTDLIFVNLLTGASYENSTQGERFSVVDGGVIYYDRGAAQIKLARPAEAPRDHPFISQSADDHRVDWVVANDGKQIAWAISNKLADEQLVSRVYLADAAGSDIRELLTYGPRAGVRLLPVAFSDDSAELYLDVHADGAGDLKPYAWHSGVFSLDLEDGEIKTLPGSANCLCAVAFGGGLMLRLAPNEVNRSIDVEVHNLDGEAPRFIPSIPRDDYDEAGNLLLSPDGGQAVYALAQVSAFRRPGQEIRSVLVLVDLDNEQQVVINNPMPALLRPLKWTEAGSAIVFTTDELDATWKISLVDGRTRKVATASYLGALGDRSAG